MLRSLLLCLCLCSCAQLVKLETGQVKNISLTTVFEMEAAYTAGPETLIAAYRRLPSCKKAAAPCRDAVIVARLASANDLALRKLRELENFARANPTLDATSAIAAAQLAISTATDLANEYGKKS